MSGKIQIRSNWSMFTIQLAEYKMKVTFLGNRIKHNWPKYLFVMLDRSLPFKQHFFNRIIIIMLVREQHCYFEFWLKVFFQIPMKEKLYWLLHLPIVFHMQTKSYQLKFLKPKSEQLKRFLRKNLSRKCWRWRFL